MNSIFEMFFTDIAELWHGVILTLGLALGIGFSMLLRRRQGQNMWDIPLIALPSIVLGILFGRIYYCHFAQQSLPPDNSVFDITNGGYALYGGMLAAGLVTLAFCKWTGVKLGKLLDSAAPGAMIAITLGRVASIFTVEDIGIDISGTIFEGGVFAIFDERFNAEVLTVYTFEIIAGEIILVALLAMFFSDRLRLTVRDGDVFLMFLFLYGCSQTALEGMREDALLLVSLGFIKISQVVSILMATVSYIIFSVRNAKANGVQKYHYLLWATSLVFLGSAFVMQFTMSNEAFMRNMPVIVCCLICYTLIGVFFYRGIGRAVQAPSGAMRARAR